MKPKELSVLLIMFLGSNICSFAQDWSNIPIPATAPAGTVWELQPQSDDFNYVAPADNKGETFNSIWQDSYVNNWTGGGNTLFNTSQSYVDGSKLAIDTDRKPGSTTVVLCGSISARQPLSYPVFIETYAKLSTSVLASCFWLVSLDQTQELDIIEAFGTDRPGTNWYSQRIHLSHHMFIRSPFQDYQPTDVSSWYVDGTYWRDAYHRVGVFWKDPKHIEYYIDGQLIRVLHDKAFANKKNGTWYYTYPTMTNGVIDKLNGYESVVQFSTSSQFSMETLQNASNVSEVSVIDPYNYTTAGLDKPLYLLVNTGEQPWTGLTATDAELEDKTKAIFWLDWIRVYKPVVATGISDVSDDENTSVYPVPFSNSVTVSSSKTMNCFEILNLNGSLVKSGSLSHERTTEIKTNDLLPGIYILKVQTSDNKWILRKVAKI